MPELSMVTKEDVAEDLEARTLDELIHEIKDVSDQLAALSKQEKALKAVKTKLTEVIIKKMEDQGVEMAGNRRAKVAITEEVVPNVKDWEQVFEFIFEHRCPELLYRQLSAGTYREMELAGINIPGTEPYTRQKLSIRKA